MKNPRPKRKLALSMITNREKSIKVRPFDSLSWEKRKSIRNFKELNKKKIREDRKKVTKEPFVSKRSQKLRKK